MKLTKTLGREGLILLALAGSGFLLVVVDCVRSRYLVMNTGTVNRYYVPTALGGIGIVLILSYLFYLFVRFMAWAMNAIFYNFKKK